MVIQTTLLKIYVCLFPRKLVQNVTTVSYTCRNLQPNKLIQRPSWNSASSRSQTHVKWCLRCRNNFTNKYQSPEFYCLKQMMQPPEIQLDRSLQLQYQDICSNPAKKEVLRRLTDQPHLYNRLLQDSSYFSQKQTLDISDNESLNLYIQHVYRKYDLQDPLERNFRNQIFENTQHSTLLNTPQKQPETKQTTGRLGKNTTTQKKLTQMRQKYKQDSSDIVSSVFHAVQPASRERRVSEAAQSRIAKQIGYRTREKIHFKTHTNEDIPLTQRTDRPEIPNNVNRQNQIKVRFNYNPEQTERQRRPRAVSEVPVCFRYCPMCEQVVLQENISFHQVQCSQIQQAYKLPLDQLQKSIKGKIQRMKSEVQKNISQQNDRSLLSQYHNLNKSLVEWLKQNHEESFERVRMGYQKIALNQYDLLVKLKWFKGLHRKLVAEASLASN